MKNNIIILFGRDNDLNEDIVNYLDEYFRYTKYKTQEELLSGYEDNTIAAIDIGDVPDIISKLENVNMILVDVDKREYWIECIKMGMGIEEIYNNEKTYKTKLSHLMDIKISDREDKMNIISDGDDIFEWVTKILECV